RCCSFFCGLLFVSSCLRVVLVTDTAPQHLYPLSLHDALPISHADGWFIVFDTLTLADDRLEAFYDNPNALRDYFKTPLIGRQPKIGRAVQQECRDRSRMLSSARTKTLTGNTDGYLLHDKAHPR